MAIAIGPLLFVAAVGPATHVERPCKVVELGSYPLRVGSSKFALLQHVAGARSPSGLILFAGGPDNTVMPNRPARNNYVLGVITDSVGNPRLVTIPMEADSVASVSVAALRDGTWAVMFVEFTVQNGSYREAKRIWHGIHDGTRWIHLDPVPIPPGEAIKVQPVSSLIQRGTKLTWAIAAREPRTGILVFSRELAAREWQVTRLNSYAGYLDLAYQHNGELLAATVGGDQKFLESIGRRSDGNSLYVRGVFHPDLLPRRAADYLDGMVHHPRFVNTPDGPLLVWTATPEGDFTQGILRVAYVREKDIEPAFDIAESVVLQPPLIVPPGNGFPLVYVTEHQRGGTARRLRFSQLIGGRVVEIGNFPDNYFPSISGVAWPGRVVVLGIEQLPQFGGMPVSVMRSFQIVCSK